MLRYRGNGSGIDVMKVIAFVGMPGAGKSEAALFLTGRIKDDPIALGLAIGLVFLALIVGIVLYSYLSYDPEFRRNALEHEVWKAINRECVRKVKHGGIKAQKQLPPALENRPVAPVAPNARAPQGRRKL